MHKLRASRVLGKRITRERLVWLDFRRVRQGVSESGVWGKRITRERLVWVDFRRVRQGVSESAQFKETWGICQSTFDIRSIGV